MKRGWLLLAAAGGLWGVRQVMMRSNPVDLNGKVVIVTGASSGIGRATAHTFAAMGAQVVLAARRAERLLDVAATMDSYGKSAFVVPVDIGEEADRQQLVDAALREFGRIDVLVNNAGSSWTGFLEDHDPAYLQQMVQVNLYAALRLIQLVLPGMLARGYGHIVNVSSGGAEMHVPMAVGYVATKAGVNGFSAALRRELAGTGVGVSWVMPGYTQTEMLDGVDVRQLRSFGVRVDAPEVPARAIVDAVRYNQRDVLPPGPVEKVAMVLHRLLPGMVDMLMGRFADRQTLADMVAKMAPDQ